MPNNNESFLNRLLRVPYLLGTIRLICMIVLFIMVYFSYNYHDINGIAVAEPLMYTNIATFLFWVFWIMAIVISVIFFGRMWCTICPLGWLNGILSMNFFKKEYPRALKNNTLLIIFTFLVLFGSMAYNIHRFPDLTARLIIFFIALVVVMGVLFKKRVFCRYLCPIGGMLGLYSKVGPVELFVKDKGVCEKCTSKQCVNGENKWYKVSFKKFVMLYNKNKDGCPVDLVPNDLKDKSACDLCMNCFYVCPHKNLNLRYRANMDDLKVSEPNTSYAIFTVVLMGLISVNFFKVYPKLKTVLYQPADYMLSNIITLSKPFAELFLALYSSVALPLVFVLIVSYIALIFMRTRVTGLDIGDEGSIDSELRSVKKDGASPKNIKFKTVFTKSAYAFIPLVLSAHIVLALVKLNTKFNYFSYIFLDPTGVKSYLSFNVFKNYEQPGVVLPISQLKWIILATIIVGLIFSIMAAKKIMISETNDGKQIGKGSFAVLTIALLIVAALYVSTVYNWLFIMGR
ncbi:4Fe-4S binding protein [Thermodesulfobacteriota bacterium]